MNIRIKKKWLFLSMLFIIFSVIIPQGTLWKNAQEKILPLESMPEAPVAIVFGASVIQNKFPSTILFDRIQAAAELYYARKVQKILMSGDNSLLSYNEAQVMKNTALDFQIPEEDIVLDYAGFRTYDTCARAYKIFGVTKAILVTQQFHLPRALYLCERFNITVYGFAADKHVYQKNRLDAFREFWAQLYAFFEIHLFLHEPKFLGEQIEMFPKVE